MAPGPGPEAEGEGQGEAEVTSEPEITSPEPEGESNDGAATLELLLPTIFLVGAIILVIVLYPLYKRCYRRRKLSLRVSTSDVILAVWPLTKLPPDGRVTPTKHQTSLPTLISDEGEMTMAAFHLYPYALREWFLIALPAILSLVFLPVALIGYKPLVVFLWPIEQYPKAPKINDVISCFLIPSGLVYAIAFGFAFQEAAGKQALYSSWVASYCNAMRQATQLIGLTQTLNDRQGALCLTNMATEALHCIKSIMNIKEDITLPGGLPPCLHTVQVLYSIKRQFCLVGDSVDTELINRLLEHLLHLDGLRDELEAVTTNMNIFQWAFLESLGYFSFFGILLVDAESYRLQLIMCVVTVLTIALFSYVLADLDKPFHGLYRVDLSRMEKLVGLLRAAHQALGDRARDQGAEFQNRPANHKSMQVNCDILEVKSQSACEDNDDVTNEHSNGSSVRSANALDISLAQNMANKSI